MAISKLPKFSLNIVRRVILTVVALVLVFTGGYYLGLRNFQAAIVNNQPIVTISRELPGNRKTLDFSLFWKVWDMLDASYFDKSKLVQANLVYGAIQGMVAAVGDPYTAFFTPDSNKIVNEDLSGGLEGVGIEIGFRGTQLSVIAPLPDTPAARAGIKAGDYILGIKDEVRKVDLSTRGMSIEQAVEKIRGPAGTKITLTLLREGSEAPLEFEITRAKIDVPSVVLNWDSSTDKFQIAHVRLLKFAGETNGEWGRVVVEINNKCKDRVEKCRIVLDLRNNPGGYLDGAVDTAADFLPRNTVVVIEDRGGDWRHEYITESNPRLEGYRMIILINKGSASASEILAGALRDQRQIKLVGDTSFGKGTIQEPDELPDGSGLHVTIAKWLTPNGTWVHGKGLEPDMKVEDVEDTKEDEQLLKAIELLFQ